MIRALSVASEIYPLVKTGGLADVTGALPKALAAEDVAVRSLVPGYPSVIGALSDAATAHHFDDLFGGPARLLAGQTRGLDLLVIDAPHLYARPGNPYAGPDGQDWPDNVFRFAALGAVAAAVGRGAIDAFAPDVVHAHDWQAGLAPAYLAYGPGPRPGTVMTVHNLAFQGQFPAWRLAALGLPPESYSIAGVEYYDSIGFLKAGLALSDRITTVSPTYAVEIRDEAGGMGLAGLLRARAGVLSGILNGIDETVWNPLADPALPSPFDRDSLPARAGNKRALRERVGLDPDSAAPLLGVVSRLTWQKGMDVLLDVLQRLLASGFQLVLLGSGEAALERGFAAAARENPGRIALTFGYDEGLAHLIQAGADTIVVPSRFEPCGLTQLCALRYGAPPIVSRVGGLNDTVIDANEMALSAGVATGFQYAPVTAEGLISAATRALAVWGQPTLWRQLQRNAMSAEMGWSKAARQYAALYRALARL